MRRLTIPWHSYITRDRGQTEYDFEHQKLEEAGFNLDRPIKKKKDIYTAASIFTQEEEEKIEDIQELPRSPQRSEKGPGRDGNKSSSKKLSGQKRRG
jgi:hypothetical protein